MGHVGKGNGGDGWQRVMGEMLLLYGRMFDVRRNSDIYDISTEGSNKNNKNNNNNNRHGTAMYERSTPPSPLCLDFVSCAWF